MRSLFRRVAGIYRGLYLSRPLPVWQAWLAGLAHASTVAMALRFFGVLLLVLALAVPPASVLAQAPELELVYSEDLFDNEVISFAYVGLEPGVDYQLSCRSLDQWGSEVQPEPGLYSFLSISPSVWRRCLDGVYSFNYDPEMADFGVFCNAECYYVYVEVYRLVPPEPTPTPTVYLPTVTAQPVVVVVDPSDPLSGARPVDLVVAGSVIAGGLVSVVGFAVLIIRTRI